jgi:hypothetical protein
MDVTWQNIPCLVREYFPHHEIFCDVAEYSITSLNNVHVVDEYINNIP